jgi:hypothetical protein
MEQPDSHALYVAVETIVEILQRLRRRVIAAPQKLEDAERHAIAAREHGGVRDQPQGARPQVVQSTIERVEQLARSEVVIEGVDRKIAHPGIRHEIAPRHEGGREHVPVLDVLGAAQDVEIELAEPRVPPAQHAEALQMKTHGLDVKSLPQQGLDRGEIAVQREVDVLRHLAEEPVARRASGRADPDPRIQQTIDHVADADVLDDQPVQRRLHEAAVHGMNQHSGRPAAIQATAFSLTSPIRESLPTL